MKNCVVLGGSGLVGSALKDIINIEFTLDDTLDFLFPSSKECNLLDVNSMDAYMSKSHPHIIINLAAHVGGLLDNMNNNLDYLLLNTKMAINLTEICVKYKPVKVVNILSTCVFPAETPLPLKSSYIHNGAPHNSNAGYSYAKRFLDISSMLMSNATDIQVINLIPTNLYGLNDNYNLKRGHVIPALLHKFYLADNQNSEEILIHGDGTDKRQFLFAHDFARIILHFSKGTFNDKFIQCIVGNDEPEISIAQLVNIIREITCSTKNIRFSNNTSGGQSSKTIGDYELLKYIPQMQTTPLIRGLEIVWEYIVNNYNNIKR